MKSPTISSLTLPVSSLNIHLNGTADPFTKSITYSPTGGVFASGFSPGLITWNYDFILMPSSQNFIIQTANALNQQTSANLNITYEVPTPSIDSFTTPVSSLIVNLHGKSASSTSGFIYSPSGGTFASGNSVTGATWSYTFHLLSDHETFNIRAYDASGYQSSVNSKSIKYQLPAPTISSITLPVSSVLVDLHGKSSPYTSGFIYSPTGGIFTSGYGNSEVTWDYKFNIMAPHDSFTIKAYDVSGYTSPTNTLSINYEVPKPYINTIDLPVSSLLVHLSGTGASSVSGFMYTPPGGVFTSKSTSSGINWDYSKLDERMTGRKSGFPHPVPLDAVLAAELKV